MGAALIVRGTVVPVSYTHLDVYKRQVLPMLKPTMISVGVLEIMWVWNDYLLPSLVLDINQYRTIPIHIQDVYKRQRQHGVAGAQ